MCTEFIVYEKPIHNRL